MRFCSATPAPGRLVHVENIVIAFGSKPCQSGFPDRIVDAYIKAGGREPLRTAAGLRAIEIAGHGAPSAHDERMRTAP
jgi:hypothetical protein